METIYKENEDFSGIDYSSTPLLKGEYENCTFKNCNFANADLFSVSFLECEFLNCDLSTANISSTAFRNVKFIECKMLGLRFNHCNDFLFEITLNNCQVDLSSFYQKNLKKTHLTNCSFKEVDFAEADLTEVIFDNCDLSGAIFDRTNLQKSDFRTSINYEIDPENNIIKKARFSKEGVIGLLCKYDILIR